MKCYCQYLTVLFIKVVLFTIFIDKALANYDSIKESYHPYIKGQYTLNFKSSDSFLEEYIEYGIGDYDIGFSIGANITKNINIELALRNSYITPSLKNLDYDEKKSLIQILEIINKKKISFSKVKKIFSVNRTVIFLNLQKIYNIDEKLKIHIGGGVGMTGILNYQGFRCFTSNNFGPGLQFITELHYNFTNQFSFYAGYNYFKNHWRHQTELIEDEEGNMISYSFEDLEFRSHGISLGLTYKF